MTFHLLQDIVDRYAAANFTVNRKLNALLREVMTEEITIDQYTTLQYIRTHENVTSSELADVFSVGKSSITAIITRLFDKELIVRLPDEKDRRVTYLTLSEEGRRLSIEVEGKIHTVLARYLCHFSEEEALAFIETYEKLARALVD